MKKYKTVVAIVTMALFFFLLPACNKLLDYFHHHPDADFKGCRIQKVSMGPDDATFYYNRLGDPDSILFPNNNVKRQVYRYNNRHRFTDLIGIYGNNSFEYWIRAIYDASGRIVRDTIYILGGIVGPDPVDYIPGLTRVTKYEYDGQNRISKTTESFPYPDFPVEDKITDYSYDGSGNQVLPGAVYDNEINIHRLNKLWMFLDREYSVNNPFIANAYNDHHLPTSVGEGLGFTRQFIWFPSFSAATIDYSCK